MMTGASPLPIYQVQDRFLRLIRQGPVVVTAPTGSGKSTEMPRWLRAMGRTLVVEPRRVACTGLATRVASLEGATLGKEVGYAVRGDTRMTADTEIGFATPGVAVRYFASGKIDDFAVLVLDEFHERGLETDLLAALARENFSGHVVITSATVDTDRLCDYFGATHLHAPGRQYPVDCHYIEGRDVLPGEHFMDKLHVALNRANAFDGHILVFLPGKAEIENVRRQVLADSRTRVVVLHGTLPLNRQNEVFLEDGRRKIILSTNVAETSLTIPDVGVVIDTGLVKRTRYLDGRGFLTCLPVAADSAEQRAGRAGRTRPGHCFRLWSERGILAPRTPPEIFRESLVPLVLLCGLCGYRPGELAFVDPPMPYAVETAISQLQKIGAVDATEWITERGKVLCRLPLATDVANLIVEAEGRGVLGEALDVASVIESRRRLFSSERRPDNPADDLRSCGCDVTAFIQAMRSGEAKRHHLDAAALAECRQRRRELARAFPNASLVSKEIRVAVLKEAVLRADPGCAYVARRKKKQVVFSNGGKEIRLSPGSAVDQDKVQGMLVLDSQATGLGYREKDAKIVATCATPVSLAWLARCGVGKVVARAPRREKGGIVIARMERVYAGCVLESEETIPRGQHAIDAIAQLFLSKGVFATARDVSVRHLAQSTLAARLNQAGLAAFDLCPYDSRSIPDIDTWVRHRLSDLGVESGADILLLSEADLTAPALTAATRRELDERFPLKLDLKDVLYDISYDIPRKEAVLTRVSGTRKEAPSVSTLPALGGFRVKVKHHSRTWVVRR